MKTLTLHKPSPRTSLIIVLVLLLLGIPLTLYQSQIQQIFKQFAWQTSQSAAAVCSPQNGKILISVQFTNKEASRAMDVTAKDLQSGQEISLGTVRRGETKSGDIIIEKTKINAGSVIFNLAWTDGSRGTDSFTANYKAVDGCSSPSPTPSAPFCPSDAPKNQGFCRWDPQDTAVEYKVVITEVESGEKVKEETVKHPAAESDFIMEPNKAYQCSITAVNACGNSTQVESPEKVCTVPTPTPYCPAEPLKESSCVWDPLPGAMFYKVEILDADENVLKTEKVNHPNNRVTFPSEPGQTYSCRVTPTGKCSQGKPTTSEPKVCVNPSGTPAPTVTPTPTGEATPTPTPTEEPTPTPTLTPTETPTPTMTPTPTLTPSPTPTNAPTPTRAPTPTPRIVQQPGQTIVQRGGVRVVQQPGQTVVQQQPNNIVVVQTTPGPTVAPTGDNTMPVIAGGITLIMALAGAILFFAL